jgi:pSer/pThr/pTyr-binding forkhead associated (FHA) protein
VDSNGPSNAPPPSPEWAPPVGSGSLMVVEASGRRTFVAAPGDRFGVGSDPSATIRIVDPGVSRYHALIIRDGPGWLVSSLDPANPIRVLDETGRAHPVLGELGLRSGTLLAGAAQVLVYPPAP